MTVSLLPTTLSLDEPLFPHIDRELDSVTADTESPLSGARSGADGGWAWSSRKKCKWG